MNINTNDLIIKTTPFIEKVIIALLLFCAFWILGVITRWLTYKIGDKAHVHKNVLILLGRTGYALSLIIGLITALGTIGINVSALVASLGLTGFALGFALRDALSNLLAGVLILIYRPFQVSDRISVMGFEGEVLDIDLRYTTLRSNGKKVLIPNSNLFTHPINLPEKV
jgi:small-conductance mechanosensitive channel